MQTFVKHADRITYIIGLNQNLNLNQDWKDIKAGIQFALLIKTETEESLQL